MSILVAILIFGALLFFHESGHFIAAKACGVTVNEFALGFGPSLFSFTKGGTKFSLKILPIGGYCMMKGEDSADMEEGSFGSKPVWQRLAIVFAGPFFNFLLAFILSIILIGNIGVDKGVVLSVTEDYPAWEAGVREGDVITRIGGKRIWFYRQISDYVSFHQKQMSSGEPLALEYIHEGQKVKTTFIPRDDGNGRYILGITGSFNYRESVGFPEIIAYGGREVIYWVETVFSGLRQIFTGGVSLNDVSGPVGVVSAIGETYEESRQDGAYYVLLNMLNIAILLSANLGVMNLLPIPALDGGRLLILLVEVVRRKRMDPEVEGRIHLAGMLVLLALMALIMVNDIHNLF